MKSQDLDSIRTEIAASIAVKQHVLADDALLQQVSALAQACVAALKAGGKSFLRAMAVVLRTRSICLQNLPRGLCSIALLWLRSLWEPTTPPSVPSETIMVMSRFFQGSCRALRSPLTCLYLYRPVEIVPMYWLRSKSRMSCDSAPLPGRARPGGNCTRCANASVFHRGKLHVFRSATFSLGIYCAVLWKISISRRSMQSDAGYCTDPRTRWI